MLAQSASFVSLVFKKCDDKTVAVVCEQARESKKKKNIEEDNQINLTVFMTFLSTKYCQQSCTKREVRVTNQQKKRQKRKSKGFYGIFALAKANITKRRQRFNKTKVGGNTIVLPNCCNRI